MADGRFYDPPRVGALLRSRTSSGGIFNNLFTGSELRYPHPSLSPGSPILTIGSTVPVIGGIVSPSTPTRTSPLPESSLSRAVVRGKQLLLERRISSTTKSMTDTDWRLVDLAIWTPETDMVVPVHSKERTQIRVSELEVFVFKSARRMG